MGYADIVTKEYMRDNAVFADAFNYLIYDGAPVITPDKLHELDATDITMPFMTKNVNSYSKDSAQYYLNLLKSAIIMQDDTASYILWSVEDKTDVHYAIPVINIIHAALQYSWQVTEIASAHKKDQIKRKYTDRSEYISGFYQNHFITPVITLVVHLGADRWDGPLSLYDMMEFKNERLKNFVPDHPIHIIDPADITDDDLLKFSTDLREVIGYIKYSKNKNRLKSFINGNPRMLIDTNAARVIRAVTDTPFKINDDSEMIDMCKAIEDMMAESAAEGRLAGIAEGRASGLAEGRASGLTEGRALGFSEGRTSGLVDGKNFGLAIGRTEGKVYALAGLLREGILSLDEAVKRTDMSSDDFQAINKKLS